MNLPETAFLHSREGKTPGVSSFDLRWFTPTVEVDLCGHATLASSHVLWGEGHVAPNDKLHFHTRSGLLKAEKRVRKGEVWIVLDFPALPEKPVNRSNRVLAKALGTQPRYVGRYGSDYLVELGSESILRGLSPDLALLKKLPSRGVLVTSAPSAPTRAKGYDFVSRFFAPG